MARRRQSLVSLLGTGLGVAFFLSVSSLMRGSEKDFIKRLVDNAPHIQIVDEYRNPRRQPVERIYDAASLELRGLKPMTETRGIRGFERILQVIRRDPELLASPVLVGQALVSFAGREIGVTINGMLPHEIRGVSTIENYLLEGSIEDLISDPNGILIGAGLAEKLSLSRGNTLTIAAVNGQVRTFKVLGIFRTGRSNLDQGHIYANLKRTQALLERINRVNSIIIRHRRPYDAPQIAARIESLVRYKTISWQENSEDLLNTLAIRNIIMYTVVSAVLVVAAFGIYNVISTVVLEKQRDLAILKSIGFKASDLKRTFVIQGLLLGAAGSIFGLPAGCLMMWGLSQITLKPPGSSTFVQMPIDWGVPQFLIAAGFAMISSVVASWLPARRAARVYPVDILRGGA